eukprot:scaffold21269_cov119-Isochrysis_galbana.AAC.1
MKSVVNTFVSKQQLGFVPKRLIGEATHLLKLIQAYPCAPAAPGGGGGGGLRIFHPSTFSPEEPPLESRHWPPLASRAQRGFTPWSDQGPTYRPPTCWHGPTFLTMRSCAWLWRAGSAGSALRRPVESLCWSVTRRPPSPANSSGCRATAC